MALALWKQIKQIADSATDGQQTTVHGWVKSRRASKSVGFVVINDGSTQADFQLVVDEGTTPFGLVPEIQTGASVKATGILRESPGKGQKWEMGVTELEICGNADAQSYPLQKKGHSLEFLREVAHLRGRTNTFGAVFRVRNQLSQLVHRFFQDQGFMWAHTPILTANDCEGAGELFSVTHFDLKNVPQLKNGQVDYNEDFFGKRAHLTVSGQLEAEIMAQAFGKVYTFGPTFRAENSNTSRHLSEFWMIEPEVAFADLKDNYQLADELLKYLLRGIVEGCPDELQFLNRFYKDSSIEMLDQVAQKPLNVIEYGDAVSELQKARVKFEYPVSWGVDLHSEHERYLTDEVFGGLVAVINYPKNIKAFYMRENDDDKTVAAMDILAPRIGEIIGGSQREDRLDHLEKRMAGQEINTSELQWYLDLRRFGSTPHAGFGLGFERLVQYVTGIGNIRDVIPFARAPRSIGF
jgi:asparaginyl-tRNA synthetase